MLACLLACFLNEADAIPIGIFVHTPRETEIDEVTTMAMAMIAMATTMAMATTTLTVMVHLISLKDVQNIRGVLARPSIGASAKFVEFQ